MCVVCRQSRNSAARSTILQGGRHFLDYSFPHFSRLVPSKRESKQSTSRCAYGRFRAEESHKKNKRESVHCSSPLHDLGPVRRVPAHVKQRQLALALQHAAVHLNPRRRRRAEPRPNRDRTEAVSFSSSQRWLLENDTETEPRQTVSSAHLE
eukprot:SAG31_NODE_10306_length_1157_cov_1.096408_1_plen_151_part_10